MKLTAPSPGEGDAFGGWVLVRGDIAFVSATGDDDNGDDSGSVFIFERDAGAPGAWGQVGQLTTNDPSTRFGRHLAVSGATLLVGSGGAVYFFERNAKGE